MIWDKKAMEAMGSLTAMFNEINNGGVKFTNDISHWDTSRIRIVDPDKSEICRLMRIALDKGLIEEGAMRFYLQSIVVNGAELTELRKTRTEEDILLEEEKWKALLDRNTIMGRLKNLLSKVKPIIPYRRSE